MIGEARASVARRVTGIGTKNVSTGKKVLPERLHPKASAKKTKSHKATAKKQTKK